MGPSESAGAGAAPCQSRAPDQQLEPSWWRPDEVLTGTAQAGREPSEPPAPRLVLINRQQPEVRRAMAAVAGLLDSGEIRQLEKQRRQEDRERFLVGRGVLRLVLGAWLGLDPASFTFRIGPYGKPELAGVGLRFNVSHSGDLILMGFHPSRDVGVDVEQLRPVPEWEGIARRCLPQGDWEAIRALPEGQRGDAFLAAWCRLEARLKARGLGLFGLEASVGPDPEVWPLALPRGYVGAAALA